MTKHMAINEILRERRLKENITFEKIFYEIHLPLKFVRMLENGDWNKFPSQLHMQGFLRIYGQYLNIPASVIEEEIQSIEKQQREKEKQEEQEKEMIQNTAFPLPKRYIYTLLLLLMFFMLIYLATLHLLPNLPK